MNAPVAAGPGGPVPPGAPIPPGMAPGSGLDPSAAPADAKTALAVRESLDEETLPEETGVDPRFERLPMQVDVMVRVHSFRVQDLLSMEKGTVVETVHEHTQDVPVRCGGAVLLWSEFEVLDQRLAVRVTRLA